MNALPGSGPHGIAAALEVIREPMFLLPIAAAGICLVRGDLHEALMLLPFVGVAMGIAHYQSHKAKRALQALREVFGLTCLHANDVLPALGAGTAGIAWFVPFEWMKGERMAAPVSWR